MTTEPHEYRLYARKVSQPTEMIPWVPGMDLNGVSMSPIDQRDGSPQIGDMIARDPNNHADRWLVSRAYFRRGYEPEPIA